MRIDKFIVGRGSAYAADSTGGSADAVIVTHNHGTSDSGHEHKYAFASEDGSTIGNNYAGSGISAVTDQGNISELEQTGAADGDRLAAYTADTETVTTGLTVDNQGVSGTNANLPPYYAIAYIMRIS